MARLCPSATPQLRLHVCWQFCSSGAGGVFRVQSRAHTLQEAFLLTQACRELSWGLSALGAPSWHLALDHLSVRGGACVRVLRVLLVYLVFKAASLSGLRSGVKLPFCPTLFWSVLGGLGCVKACVQHDVFLLFCSRSRISPTIPATTFFLSLHSQTLPRTSVGHFQNFSKDSYRHVENRPQRQI